VGPNDVVQVTKTLENMIELDLVISDFFTVDPGVEIFGCAEKPGILHTTA
jgi:hypothetical protein